MSGPVTFDHITSRKYGLTSIVSFIVVLSIITNNKSLIVFEGTSCIVSSKVSFIPVVEVQRIFSSGLKVLSSSGKLLIVSLRGLNVETEQLEW